MSGFPGLRRKSLNVSADVDASPGVPGEADFGGSENRLFWGPPDFGGSGWRGLNLPISYIYREGFWGVLQ